MKIFKELISALQPTEEKKNIPESLQEIVFELNDMPEEEANELATYGFLLARVARADLSVSDEERQSIVKILVDKAGFSAKRARGLAILVEKKNEWRGSTDNYIVAREFGKSASDSQKKHLMTCLFAVAAADQSISGQEEKELKQIAAELKMIESDFLEVISDFREYRDILKS